MGKVRLWFMTIFYPAASAFWDYQAVAHPYNAMNVALSYVTTALAAVLVTLSWFGYWYGEEEEDD